MVEQGNNQEAEKEFNWPPLESDPSIFQSYMRDIGLPEPYGFAELFGMDEELLAMVPQPVDAVIAGVAVQNKAVDRAKGDLEVKTNFYMKQNAVLDNACGVIACIHSIFNNMGADKIQLAEGSLLAKHHANVKDLATAEEKCAALQNFKEFQDEYKKRSGEGQSNQVDAATEQVAYHFICFVISPEGHLVELDGCKVGPNVIKENCGDILKDACAEMKRRLDANEVSDRMNLMVMHHGEPMF